MSLRNRLSNVEKRTCELAHDRSPTINRHALECLMRYGLVHNHLRAAISPGHKKREVLSDEEWSAFIARSVAHFNGNMWHHKEERMILLYLQAHVWRAQV
jgi:hypothetical protein